MICFRRVALCALAPLLPLAGGDLGLGVSLKSNEGSIFVPYKVNDRWMVEGVLHHRRAQFERRGPDGTHGSLADTSTSAGLGILWRRPLTEASSLYAGPRLSYIRNSYKNAFTNEGSGGVGEVVFRSSSSGLGLAPTLGFEYFPIRNLSIGGEAAAAYVKMDGANANPNSSDISSRSTYTETTSSLIVRMYF